MTSWHLSRVAVLVIIFAGAAALSNCTRILFATLNAPSYIGDYRQHVDIPYGTGARQKLDIYVPLEAKHRPIVIFWYGGTWVKGAKEWYRFVGASLAESGYVAVLPDYHLYPQARFPGFIRDGAQAVKWIREHAAELGGDPDAIFLMGHSAGAHIAATLALDQQYLRAVGGDSKWVRGWISLSAPYALESRFGNHLYLRGIFREASVPTDWELIALAAARSPPALLIHGTRDIYPGDALAMSAKLRSLGSYVECHIYDGVSHMDTVSAFSLPLRFEAPSLRDVQSFIDRALADPHVADGTSAGLPCPELEINEKMHSVKLVRH